MSASPAGERGPLTVSLVIPARNEVGSIAAVVAEAREALGGASPPWSVEILVIDDASWDGTAAAAASAGARVVGNSERRGYGGSIKRGLRLARGEVVAIVDADGTYPLAQLPTMLELLLAGADQVVGARVGDRVAVPPLRRPGKWLVTQLARWLTGRAILDLNSGLRCFWKDRVGGFVPLLPDGFSLSTTLTVAGLLAGWEIVWHPVDYRMRVGRSKFRALRDTWSLLLTLVRTVVYYDPLRVFLPVAVGLGLSAMGFLGWDMVVENNLTDKTVLLSLAAIELFVLGLLADLIVRRGH